MKKINLFKGRAPFDKEKVRRDRSPLKTLLPITLWMGIFIAVPIILVILVSFLSRGQYGEIVYKFTFNNYKRMMNPLYYKILWNSFLLSFFTTLLCLVLGYPFAYFIAKSSNKVRPILLMLVMIPFWTNSLVRTYAWIILLRSEGVINSYLLKLGIISQPLKLLYNNGSVLLGMFYMLFPFMVLPLYASIEKLDFSFVEAAYDLGANPMKTFIMVTLPLTMPGIFAGCLLVFVPTLGYFFISDLMGGSKIIFLSNLIKNQFLTSRDWPFGAALSVVLIIIMVVLIGAYVKTVGTDSKGVKSNAGEKI